MRNSARANERIPSPRARACGPNPTAVLAFDFGEQRTGAAVGDLKVGIAHPLATIDAADKKTRYAAIAELIREWRPALLVVGLPLALDGSEHELTRLARKFARELNGRFELPVEFADERLSSAAAESSLAETGVAGHKRKPLVDRVAAQHILQAWLDESARRAQIAQVQQ